MCIHCICVFSPRFGLMLPPRSFTLWVQGLGSSLRLPVTTNLTTTATGKSRVVPGRFLTVITSCRWLFSLSRKWIEKQQSAGLVHRPQQAGVNGRDKEKHRKDGNTPPWPDVEQLHFLRENETSPSSILRRSGAVSSC